MPSRVKSRELRLSACRLLLELVRGIAASLLKTEAFGTYADEVILTAAILVGQGEGRPMTAAKLANYAGMPRPTVVRKLRSLEARGLVKRVNGGVVLPVELINSITPPIMLQPVATHVQKVALELSKMDSKAVAKQSSTS